MDKQQDELKCLPPFAAPASQHSVTDAELCKRIDALLALDAAGALTPHGVGGLARELLTQASTRLAGAARQGGVTSKNMVVEKVPKNDVETAETRMDTGFDGAGRIESSTAPTVEVDDLPELPPLPLGIGSGEYIQRDAVLAYGRECARAALINALLQADSKIDAIADQRASKPPAREAAERQSIDTPEFRALMDEWVCTWTPKLPQRSLFAKIIAHIDTWGARRDKNAVPALDRYKEFMRESEEPDPLERLRFFCSLAMSGRDWLDVEPFFDALIVAAPAAGNTAQPGD